MTICVYHRDWLLPVGQELSYAVYFDDELRCEGVTETLKPISSCCVGIDCWNIEGFETTGEHFVRMVLDSENTIYETDEANNVVEHVFWVR